MSKNGFIFSRPHDLHFIMFCAGFWLMMIPVWPAALWYLSGLAMVFVQTFNSASKPVLAESLHRLATLLEADPVKVFAQANTMREVGNAVVGLLTPILYIAYPASPFYCIGALELLFLGVLLLSLKAVNNTMKSFAAEGTNDTSPVKESVSTKDKSEILSSTPRTSFDDENASYAEDISSDDESSTNTDGSVITRLRSFIRMESACDLEAAESEEDEIIAEEEERLTTYFLIVHAFPTFDTIISRLPFAFLTVAVASHFSVAIASLVLVAYQISRAISQIVQAWRCTPATGYFLNGCGFCAYITLVVLIELYQDAETHWFTYIPFAFAGLAETLPTQQLYLGRMYGFSEGENIKVRRAVKASHTGTGIGSMVAFLAGPQIYQEYGLLGVAYFGVSIQMVKILTCMVLDLHLLPA